MRISTVLLLLFLQSAGAFAQKAPTEPFELFGTASFYAQRFEGRRTASGAIFRQDSLTAAHKSLPLGTKVKVTNRENDQSIEVIINDRMSKRSPHIIDLSKRGAIQLGMVRTGFALVSIEVIPTLPTAIDTVFHKPDSP